MQQVSIRIILQGMLIRFAVLSAVFSILVVLVTLIPAQAIFSNAAASYDEIQADSGRNNFLSDEAALAPTYTTAIMFSILLHQDASDVFQAAFRGEYYDGQGASFYNPALNYAQKPNTIYSYYWHGWMVCLKPLLIIFNYSELKRLFSAFFILAAILLCLSFGFAIKAPHGWVVGLTIPISIALLRGFDAVTFLPFFFPILISLLSSIWLTYMWQKQVSKTDWMVLSFFTIGALTAFFDFLTTPILTYSIPALCVLTLLFLSRESDKTQSLLDVFAFIFFSGICWIVGYVGLWAAKWIIASIALHQDVVGQALNEILFRTGAANESPWGAQVKHISRLEAIRANFNTAFPKSLIYLNLTLIITTCIIALIKRPKIPLNTVIGFATIGLLPYVWYFLVSNHSYIHYYFTCRNQIASQAAILMICAVVFLLSKRKANNPES